MSARADRLKRTAAAGLFALALLGAYGLGSSGLTAGIAHAQKLTDEIKEFCGNIADAARDRRYAVQAQELEKLRGEIDDRIAALEAKRAEYEKWLARREEVINRAEDSVVGIYAKMKPDAAAQRMERLDAALAAAILLKLNHRQAGVILNEMDSKAAAMLTAIIADVAKAEDPT